MVHVLVVEDEKRTADMLKELIENQSDYLVVNVCDSIDSTVAYLRKNQQKLDLIFLDIQLADGESFEIFGEVEVTIPVIFCTAYDEHLLKAFQHNGINYLLKPIREQDIDEALSKFERLRSSFSKSPGQTSIQVQELIQDRKPLQKTFLARYRDKMIPVSVNDIGFILLKDEVVYLYTFDGERFPVFKKMEEIAQALDSNQFFRINRQMMVNREAIREIEPYFNRKVVVFLTFELPEKAIVSRLKVSPFMKWIEGS
ncbi:MAG: LytTR family DNA-binding domain-containing protein [Bacteroidota bacterium]